MEVPQLIIDLAVMLTTAAIVTISFKRLRIPTILGYIVAGFIIGPHFPAFMTVESIESIETWSEIGVVIILFHIGLEFDFNKLSEIGSTALVSAAVKMSGVMLVGYGFGMLLGMSMIDSVFLGAMLSISSTVVIQKCFSEMGLENEKYAKLVMGSLVMEDVFAVFIMVVLTAMSVRQSGSGSMQALQMFLMITYLILWLVLGIFFVPTLLDKAMEFMNDESLTLLSIGFCFLMGLYARWLGFSMELGAFVAGSLFGGTRHSHNVERVTAGIKDMFGAVFFLSVGMLVEPAVITARWTSILPIALVAVTAKLIFASIGMILSGQDADTALRGGISLAPIGEFSFIIAGLGISLGVMDDYLYPVIVSASIITIMATPVLIRQSDRIVSMGEKLFPEKLKLRIQNYTSDERESEEKSTEWRTLLKDYFVKGLLYGSIMLVFTLFACRHIYPFVDIYLGDTATKILTLVIIYSVILIFAMPFLGRRNAAYTKLWMDSLANRPPLVAMTIIKLVIIELIGLIPLARFFDLNEAVYLILVPLSIMLLARSEFVTTYYLQLETRFLANLNQKIFEERGGARSDQNWLDEDYSIFSWHIPEDSPFIGKTLQELNWGKNYSVYAVKLKRGDRRMPMPTSRTTLMAGDKLHMAGDRESLEAFYKAIGIEEEIVIRTLREFFDVPYEYSEYALGCAAIKVRGTESYAGKSIKRSGINAKTHCMILGIERDGYAQTMPDANMLIEKGDILWVIGTEPDLRRLASHSLGKAGTHAAREA